MMHGQKNIKFLTYVQYDAQLWRRKVSLVSVRNFLNANSFPVTSAGQKCSFHVGRDQNEANALSW